MKGNIFSIELIMSAIIIITAISLIYSNPDFISETNFPIIKFENNKMQIFYFNENIDEIQKENYQHIICQNIFYYTDQNLIDIKQICEGIK